MKKLASRDQFIKDHIEQYQEFYMIITCQETGRTSYTIITNLYCDPFYFKDLKGSYKNGYYLTVNAKQFFNKFKRYKKQFIEINSNLGFDRIVYKRIN